MFVIGDKVTSKYHGITGVVIGLKPPVPGCKIPELQNAAIKVEYQTPVLGKASEMMTDSRTFIQCDFVKA